MFDATAKVQFGTLSGCVCRVLSSRKLIPQTWACFLILLCNLVRLVSVDVYIDWKIKYSMLLRQETKIQVLEVTHVITCIH